jgi:hypothetical protein
MHGMKWVPIGRLLGLALVIFFASPLPNKAAQFVQLTTEIQMCDWDYQFFYDRDPRHHENAGAPSIFTENAIRRCVIGESAWMVESTHPTFTETFWFTGTNIIAHTVITRAASAETAENLSKVTKLAAGVPPVGHRYTRIHESADGNPGRPGGVADLMGFNLSSRICWLAFCSAPALKHEGRRIFPPSDLWKESSLFYSGWSDSTKVFQDALSLPSSIDLVSTNGQPIFQYQVRQSTNILGWQIPLEYYGVQYLPTGSNRWKLHLTFKGKVTSIALATAPEIPSEVMEAVEK